jgi:hypothetical protein
MPPVTTLHRPTHRDALVAVTDAIESGDLCSILGRCTVEYEGRAASSLGAGDRLVLLKPDGSALVHTEEGRTPVNWQPPGSDHTAAVRDGTLHVVSRRENPDETLTVVFEAVYQVTAMDADDDRELDLRKTEADLQHRIVDDPETIEEGFEVVEVERRSSAGAMDIFGRDSEGRPVVVELKRRRVGPGAVGQLSRYVEAVRREEGVGDGGDDGSEDSGETREVRGVLVAPSVTPRAEDLLARDGFEFVAVELE